MKAAVARVYGQAGRVWPAYFRAGADAQNRLGSIVGTRLGLAASLSFAAEGRVKVHYPCEPLERINQVFTEMTAGRIDGRVVLDIN